MRISLKFVGDAFTFLVLLLGTGAFQSLVLDNSTPEAVAEGSPLMQGLWLAIYALAALRAVQHYREIKEIVRANKLLVLLEVLAILSAIWSADAGVTLRRGIAVVATTLFAMDLATRYSIREQLRLLGYVLGFLLLLSVMFQIFMPDLIPAVDSGYSGAWHGVFQQKNEFARMVALATLVFLTRSRPPRWSRLVTIGLITVSAALILVSQSRTALVVMAAVLVLLRIFRLRRHGTKALIGGIVAVVLVGMVLSIAVDTESMAGMLGRDTTMTGRTKIWTLALESLAERPFLGYGYSAFWNVSPEALRISQILHWQVPHAHNGFIDLPLQLGFVGLILFLAVYVVAVWRAIAYAYSDPDSEALWPIAYFAFVLLYQFTESTIFVGNSMLWMVFISTMSSVSTFSSAYPIPIEIESVPEPVPSFAAGKEYA
jgi:exopolysaccharide production protein ExoQ